MTSGHWPHILNHMMMIQQCCQDIYITYKPYHKYDKKNIGHIIILLTAITASKFFFCQITQQIFVLLIPSLQSQWQSLMMVANSFHCTSNISPFLLNYISIISPSYHHLYSIAFVYINTPLCLLNHPLYAIFVSPGYSIQRKSYLQYFLQLSSAIPQSPYPNHSKHENLPHICLISPRHPTSPYST